MKNKLIILLVLSVLIFVGCTPATPESTQEVVLPTAIITEEQTVTETLPVITEPSGTQVTFGELSFLIPPGVADGASSVVVDPLVGDEPAWWQKTPGHLQVMLDDYYSLKDTSLQPRIYLYPALEYAQLVPAAFESMHRLNNIFASSADQISSDELPPVPFFNAVQVFAAQFQYLNFQNGKGIRFLSEYGQSAVSANNKDLFYQFQGLSNDGNYYIIAIFPVSVPGFAESFENADSMPINGVSLPVMGDPESSWDAYYSAAVDLLNNTSPDNFTPSLNDLDALIQSILITP